MAWYRTVVHGGRGGWCRVSHMLEARLVVYTGRHRGALWRRVCGRLGRRRAHVTVLVFIIVSSSSCKIVGALVFVCAGVLFLSATA